MTGPIHVPISLANLTRQLSMRGWSKSELARRAGVWPSAISHVYRHGWCSPQLYRRIALALAEAPVSADGEALLAEASA